MSEVPIRIRDRRKKGWFWMDNAVLDDHGASLGVYALATYAVICRHSSNEDGRCQMSQGAIARKIGCSRSQVKRELQKLEERGFIETHHVFDGPVQKSSEYFVLSTPGWYLTDPGSHRPGVTQDGGVGSDRAGGGVTQSHFNKDSINKDLNIKTGAPTLKQLNEWMESVRRAPLPPSLLVEMDQLGADALEALRAHSMFSRELEDLEDERSRRGWMPQ